MHIGFAIVAARPVRVQVQSAAAVPARAACSPCRPDLASDTSTAQIACGGSLGLRCRCHPWGPASAPHKHVRAAAWIPVLR